ncbi:MAG: carbohydrate ABC transporter permease [Rubrobacter sp.]
MLQNAGRTPEKRQRRDAGMRILERTGFYVAVCLILFFCLFPIFWMLLTAFKPVDKVYSTSVLFEPTLRNFRIIFGEPLSFGPLVANSLIVAIGTTLLAIPISLGAAYAFSRLKFRGNTTLLVIILATQFIPPVAIALPFFTLFENVGLIDTLQGLVIANLAVIVPYSIWMMKGFIDALPEGIEEAAFIDGCGELSVVRYVTFPLVMPGILISATFAFILSWNEFLFPFLLTREAAVTMPVGLMSTQGTRGVLWEQMSAAGMLVMVPVLIMSLFIRKHFIEGITMGAVK